MSLHEDEVKNYFNTLNEIGCCKLCILRFLGETENYAFLNYRKSLSEKGIVIENDSHKVQKNNACVACLGLLEQNVVDSTVRKVCDAIEESAHDSSTYVVALTVPVNFLLRARSLWIYLKRNFPNVCHVYFPLNLVTVNPKEVWKWVANECINMGIHKSFDVSSDFSINLNFQYDDDDVDSEESCLTQMGFLAPGKHRRNSKIVYSRKAVENFLNHISDVKFSMHYSVPPKIPTKTVYCDSVSLLQQPIYFAGRYNKFSRDLPQTPWIIDGKRRIENSLQEIISGPILDKTKATDDRFSASGREDVDVRTLGTGRPFIVELVDPRVTIIRNDEMREIENNINRTGYGKVAVRDLQLVYKQSLKYLKEGEEYKKKTYAAYCIAFGPLPDNVEELSTQMPLKVLQKTPIRVLHRRPFAVRSREIYSLKIVPHISTSDPKGKSFFKLFVETQAGTYVKEFVHGDFGRTSPSLRDLLNGTYVDILALDVMKVSLKWPPEVDYSDCTQ